MPVIEQPDTDRDDVDAEDNEPTSKRRTLDPLLRGIDRVFAAMDELPADCRDVAVMLVNRRYGG